MTQYNQTFQPSGPTWVASPANGTFTGPWIPGDIIATIAWAVCTQAATIFIEGSNDQKTVSGSATVTGAGLLQTTSIVGFAFYRVRYVNNGVADVLPITVGVIDLGLAGAGPSGPPGPPGTSIAGIDPSAAPYNVDFTGATDSATGMNSAYTALGIEGNRLNMKAGNVKVNSTVQGKGQSTWWGIYAGLIDSTGDATDGTCLVWGGAASGTMLRYFDTEYVVVDGIAFDDPAGPGNGVTALLLDSDNNPTFHTFFMRNFGITNVAVAIQIAQSLPSSFEVDRTVIQQGTIQACTTGIRIQSDNAADAGLLSDMYIASCNTAIQIDACGFLTIARVIGGGQTGVNPSFIKFTTRHNPVLIQQCQYQGSAKSLWITSTAGADYTHPIILDSNVFNSDVVIDANQQLIILRGNTFTGNFILNGNSNLIVNEGFNGGLNFVFNGTGNQVLDLTIGQSGAPLMTLTNRVNTDILNLIAAPIASSNQALVLDGTGAGGKKWKVILPGTTSGIYPAKALAFRNDTDSNTPLQLHDNGVQVGSGGTIFSGSGAPNIAASVAGDMYIRIDTPGTANQRFYVATAVNTWSGVV